jgi:penicillin-binding protein 1A
VRQFLAKRWGDEFVYNQGGAVEITMDSALQHVADSALRFRLDGIRARMRQRTASAYGLPKLLKLPMDSLLLDWDRQYARFEREFVETDTATARERFPREYRYRRPQAALLVVENATGAVRALVGGENFETSKYNRALQAVRSPGSSFKPFVYASAVERGGGPGDILNDQPISIPEISDTSKIWQPTNFDDGYEGRMTMRRAFYRSQNLPAVEVALKYGLDNVSSLARRAGFRHRVDPVPSLALGSCDVTLLELVSAYTIFPNGGFRVEPYFVERVSDRGGKVLYRNEARREEVLSPEAAWIVTSMLRDVNIRGTAAAVWASGFRHPSGGKTGTTNEFTDAWYVGFTRGYTAGIWVGIDDYSPMGTGHTGSANAVPLWVDLMRVAERGRPLQDFPRPDGVAEVSICPVSGLRAQFYCSGATPDYYVAGHEPESCSPLRHLLNRKPDAEREAPPEPATKKEAQRLRKTF